MDCTDLTREQGAKLMRLLGRQLRTLNRLCERMNRRGFPPDDPLNRAALAARNAVQDLHTVAHYASGVAGAGRPTKSRGSAGRVLG